MNVSQAQSRPDSCPGDWDGSLRRSTQQVHAVIDFQEKCHMGRDEENSVISLYFGVHRQHATRSKST